jgi:hypothetical protein
MIHHRRFCMSLLLVSSLVGLCGTLFARQAGQRNPLANDKPPANDSGSKRITIDPALFIRVYEDSGNKRILLYSWQDGLRSRQLHADPGSVLIIEPDLRNVDKDTVINNLYMSAQLGGADKPVDVPVLAYSEIGKSAEGAESQKAVSFQTLRDIKENVSTIYWTSREILTDIDRQCFNDIVGKPGDFKCKPLPIVNKAVAGEVLAAFAHKQPEIKSISDFISDPKNEDISRALGNKVFGLSAPTVAAIAKQYEADFEILLAKDKTTPEQVLASATSLYDRTQLIIRDFCVTMKEEKINKDCSNATQVDNFLNEKANEHLESLKRLTVPGQIVLPSVNAQDGQSLTVIVESKAKGAAGAGPKAVFDIKIRNLGTKMSISPTVFFITRVAVNSADLTRKTARFKDDPAPVSNPISSLSGSPFPGVSLLLTHYHRGLNDDSNPAVEALGNREERLRFRARSSNYDKFLNAIAPGIGVNTTFMSFADPRDFDPSTNQFTKTNGSNFQVGVGPTISIFNNALQFTYGWNLNVDQRRRYVGIGFGFVEVGKTFASFLKKQ